MVYPNKGLIGIFCSISAIEVSTAIVTPVRPTPAEQWTRQGSPGFKFC